MTELFTFGFGETVSVRKCFLRFKRWEPPTDDTYGGKVEINHNGERVFAELAILPLLQKDGFDGVWVNPRFGKNKFWRALCVEGSLPEHIQALYDEIVHVVVHVSGSHHGGCWDVLAWKADACLFVESKRRYEDGIRDSQKQWLDAAMRTGIAPSCFIVCEWDISERVGR